MGKYPNFSHITYLLIGMHLYLTKPVEKELLITIISKLKNSSSLIETREGISGDLNVVNVYV